jgi:hypothetical protein
MTFFTTKQPPLNTDSDVDTYKFTLKEEYRRLAHTHHPDKGGNEDDFKALTLEYEQLLASAIPRSRYTAGGTTSDPATSGTPTHIVLGVERTVRKKRAVEPQHVEIKFNITLDELNKGLQGQELKYQRRVYDARYNTPSVQEVTLNVNINSWQLNKHGEIVFAGYGDQGLLGDKADLVLLIRIEDDVVIDYTPTSVDPDQPPIIVQQVMISAWDTEIKINLLGIDYTFPITENTVSLTKNGAGLRFKRADGTLVRGPYKLKIFRRT